MTRPAILRGDRRTAGEVAALALGTVRPVAPREWLLRLGWVRQDRRDSLRELRQAGHGARSRDVVRRGERFGAAGVAWWLGMAVGATLVVSGAALLLPTRRSSTRTIEDGMWQAPAVLVAGALVLCVLALLPPPGVVRESATATGAALASGGLSLVSVSYNAPRIAELRATEHGDRAGAYLLAAAAAFAASAVLAVRARERRPHHRVHWRHAARRAARHARWLLRRAPSAGDGRALAHEWGEALAAIGPGRDPEVLAQARALGPWHFLVAACYDGELEVPRISLPQASAGTPAP